MSDKTRIVFEHRIRSDALETTTEVGLLVDEIIESCTDREAAALLRQLAFRIMEDMNA